jgi:hypothetical protein
MANVHKTRLIRDYEEWYKNYEYERKIREIKKTFNKRNFTDMIKI